MNDVYNSDPVGEALRRVGVDVNGEETATDSARIDSLPSVPADISVDTVSGEDEEAFDYNGYQVVRREFFSHINEPSVTFNNCKIGVNRACLCKLPDVEYVQILVNPNTMKLAIRPCSEGEKDAFVWCNTTHGKKQPKQITCKLFFAMVVQLMDWNPDYRYKMLGKLIRANGDYLFIFDLASVEIYQRTFIEGEKPKTARVPVFPAGWKGQFGLPVEEHRKSLQINILDGYAVYEIKERQKQTFASTGSETTAVSTNTDSEQEGMVRNNG